MTSLRLKERKKRWPDSESKKHRNASAISEERKKEDARLEKKRKKRAGSLKDSRDDGWGKGVRSSSSWKSYDYRWKGGKKNLLDTDDGRKGKDLDYSTEKSRRSPEGIYLL